jgi:hypothetical protein
MRKFHSAAVAALVLSAVACGDKPARSGPPSVGAADASSAADANDKVQPVDPTVAASLRDEIKNVQVEIAAAEAESARYSGGLVKALIESRIATFKQTLAMLEQRDKAWTFGLRLQYTINGQAFSLPAGAKDQLPDVEHELRDLATQIQSQEQEVSRYSGGLVQAMGLSTLATMKQTEAMLNQRRLSIRFELPQYLAFQSSAPRTAVDVSTLQPATVTPPAAANGEDWEVVSVASRPGESNSSWTRFSWKLTILNRTAFPQTFDALVEFRDADGFPVDSDSDYNLVVPAGAQETFTGEKLVNASQVGRIATTAAKVKKDS